MLARILEKICDIVVLIAVTELLLNGDVPPLNESDDTTKEKAEPARHGEWVEGSAHRDDDGYILQNYKCSVCECEIEYIETDYNFCPYCGAKMDRGYR